jgi:catechol 2,3-dioxygenase-like lactoylglutathione lyase family enzyme
MAIELERIDHLALEVSDFDARLRAMTDDLGLECTRIGRLGGDPTRRIAMLRDATGFKIELVEAAPGTAAPTTLAHVAWRVADVAAAHDSLCATGYESIVAPRSIEAARAESALVRTPDGLSIQLIRYEPDSPDL